MTTTMEQREGRHVPFGRNDQLDLGNDRRDAGERQSLWAPICATAGAVVWAGMAVLARMGIARVGAIELLFLFAPLVIVPLAMELGRGMGGTGRLEELARRLQPVGAGLAVVAMCLPPGRKAGLVAGGWMVVCGLMAGGGVLEVVRSLLVRPWRDADIACPEPAEGSVRATLVMARLDLAVGGAWLVASRLGMRPMGIQEPIGLLTAVHFHFAGFATAMIAAATLRFAEGRGENKLGLRWLKPVALMVAGMPVVVAAGFLISPAVKMSAAILFSASVAGLAIAVRACGRKAEDATARILLQVAAGAVFAGMVLSASYAVADYMGSAALTIPQMARTHGILNAVGFCLPGLLGWLVERSGCQSPVPSTQ
jgi:YndJ-like protein